jgi:hypothetical protein
MLRNGNFVQEIFKVIRQLGQLFTDQKIFGPMFIGFSQMLKIIFVLNLKISKKY